jgi:uncharacterized protein (DUF1697 family)
VADSTYIALLRGINVGGHNRIPMRELLALCGQLGWRDARSYIQSGNLVFQATGKAVTLEAALERVIAESFDLTIPVIVRSAAKWPAYLEFNPFAAACCSEPNRVMLALSKLVPLKGAAAELQKQAVAGETVVQAGDGLWIHYPQGAAKSKLSPGLLDRTVGSPVTTRNWNTVVKLDELSRARARGACT